MAESTSHCNRLVVAAFDFGTTFSGYAFSFRDSPLDIKTNPSWIAGSEKLISMKTPTCVLLKPNKEFHSFGFEAENKYSDLAEDDEHHGWYMFRRFKMMLYDTKNLRLDTTIEDISGKKMPALTIIGHSIRYLKDHLLKTLNNQTVGVEPGDIQYILTVPAIWDQKAKEFMRKAAYEGGIKDDQLKIALEPEAASIWCQVATDHKLSGLAEVGSKYMVVDLGGGTADITVHEKMADGTLKELHNASGGSWGGTQVDKAYEEMLTNIIGADAMKKFKKEHVGDYFDLLRDFETKKRTITSDTDGKMTFKIPAALKECAESRKKTMKDLIEKSQYRGKMTSASDKIRVEREVARSLFHTAIEELTNHVKELLSYPDISMIDAILLVGGFGECELVKNSFEKNFPNKKLLIPADAGLAVLKGSVKYGHLPEIVSVRVTRFTYGISVVENFDKRLHDTAKKVLLFGHEKCKDLFSIIVRIGEKIPIGTEKTISHTATSLKQNNVFIQFFSSIHENPKYVTDEGCTYLGNITMDLPESDNFEDTMLCVYLTFGSTELKARALIRKTNKSHETVINCFE